MTLLDTKRELAKPVEQAWCALQHNVGFLGPLHKLEPSKREAYGRHVAKTVIAELRRLGFINDIGLQAIKAEEGKGNA